MKQIIFIFLILLNFCDAKSQQKDKQYFVDMSKALGYAYGIKMSNDKIVERFPDLATRATLAEMDFNIEHGEAVKKIENELSATYNLTVEELKSRIFKQLIAEYNSIGANHDEAKAFLTHFKEERIKGNHEIYTEFVSILLRHNPNYNSLPFAEFADGYLSRFDSDNHPKSKGLNLSLEYPKSWIAQEGKHPNILTTLKSYDGSCYTMILVKDLAQEILAHEQVDSDSLHSFLAENKNFTAIFTPEYVTEFIKENGLENIENYTYEESKLEGQPTIIVKSAGKLTRGSREMQAYNVSYLIFYKKYVINITSMIINKGDNFEEEKNKYIPLSEMIHSSLILKDKWK